MSEVEISDRRRTLRQRIGRLATARLGVGINDRYVLVTNASEEGVRLQLNGFEIVDQFVLLFHGNGGPARDGTYQVVWREGRDIGAKFVNPNIRM